MVRIEYAVPSDTFTALFGLIPHHHSIVAQPQLCVRVPMPQLLVVRMICEAVWNCQTRLLGQFSPWLINLRTLSAFGHVTVSGRLERRQDIFFSSIQ